MSNTPTTRRELYPTCKRCDQVAHWAIGTSDSYGPQHTFTTYPSAAKYCLPHAVERAAELLPAWEARQQASREAHNAAHDVWRKQYDATKTAQEFIKDCEAATTQDEYLKLNKVFWSIPVEQRPIECDSALSRLYGRVSTAKTIQTMEAMEELHAGIAEEKARKNELIDEYSKLTAELDEQTESLQDEAEEATGEDWEDLQERLDEIEDERQALDATYSEVSK